MRVSSFEWDPANIAKVEDHDLASDDVEWLFALDAPIFRLHAKVAARFVALGFVPDGRFVLVVFDSKKRRRSVRVVTAYEPTDASWRRRYEAAKKA